MKGLTLFLTFILFTTLSLNAQTGPGPVFIPEPKYNAMPNDRMDLVGLVDVKKGADNKWYGLFRYSPSVDQRNGPSGRKKLWNFQGIWGVNDYDLIVIPGLGLRQSPKVSHDDGIPVAYKTFRENNNDYIWLKATSETSNMLYWNSQDFQIITTVAYLLSTDWLGLFYNPALHSVIHQVSLNENALKPL